MPHNRSYLPQVGYASTPNKLVWQDEYRIQPQVQRPVIPDGNINDRRDIGGRFPTEYNPYFWAQYKTYNMY